MSSDLVQYLTSGPVIALEIRGVNAVSQWLKLAGPADPAEAKQTSPSSLRAMFGTDSLRNAIHGSDNEETAKRVSINFLSKRNFSIKELE